MNLQETAEIQCPYCSEAVTLFIDCSAGDQAYTEDCQVCCRPMIVIVTMDEDGNPAVTVRREDD